MPGAVGCRCQKPLVAIPWAEERMGESMSTELARDQQPDALLPALHKLLHCFGATPATGRAGWLGSFALPGTLGYLIEDEFIHFAPVALWRSPRSFFHAFDNRMDTCFDE